MGFSVLLLLLAVTVCYGQGDIQTGEELQEDGMEDAPATYIGGMMSSFFQKFEKMKDEQRRKEFNKLIPTIDKNNDAEITFDELHEWVWKNVEDEAKSLDFSRLEILDSDTDKDGKLSWQEMEADHRKRFAETSGKEGYMEIGKELKREKIRFQYIDHNNDGFVTTDEFPRLVMPDNFADMNEVAVDHYILDYDDNDDGKISKVEFMKHARRDPNIEDPERHFDLHDTNKGGILTRDEIREHALETISAPYLTQELRAIFRILDKDADGLLWYSELSKGYKFFTDTKEAIPDAALEGPKKDEL